MTELTALKQRCVEAAEWFLLLRGTALQQEGYKVVFSSYDLPGRDNSIVITKLPEKNVVSLAQLQRRYASIKKNTAEELRAIGRD